MMWLVLACIIGGMKPNIWLLLEASGKGSWRVEYVTETEACTAQIIQAFPTVNTALNIRTSSVLVIFLVMHCIHLISCYPQCHQNA